jgi:hypothetical protein
MSVTLTVANSGLVQAYDGITKHRDGVDRSEYGMSRRLANPARQ